MSAHFTNILLALRSFNKTPKLLIIKHLSNTFLWIYPR